MVELLLLRPPPHSSRRVLSITDDDVPNVHPPDNEYKCFEHSQRKISIRLKIQDERVRSICSHILNIRFMHIWRLSHYWSIWGDNMFLWGSVVPYNLRKLSVKCVTSAYNIFHASDRSNSTNSIFSAFCTHVAQNESSLLVVLHDEYGVPCSW